MSTSPAAPPADPALPHLEAARQHIAQGQLQQAALALNEAQRRMPGDARAFLLAALMAEKAGNPAGADQAFGRCLALAPDWVPGLLECALYHARRDQFPRALELAEKVARMAPNDPRVLAGVVDIANRAGDWAMAVRHLRRGLEQHPGDATLRRYLAQALEHQQEYTQAEQIRDALIAEDGSNPRLRFDRVLTCLAREQPEKSLQDIEWLEQHHPDLPHLDYYAALARGQTPKDQPPEMARAIFDDMAERFDQHLVKGLGYRLPRLVADQLAQRWPQKDFNLLDLGCGTGLLGACLAPMRGFLIGVDLSKNMLEQAAKHGVYYRFHHINLLDALRETPSEEFEVIACLDVLPYVGDLHQVLPGAARILKSGGCFIFACEQASEDGPDLTLPSQTQRFQHKRSHAEALCRQYGLEPQTQEFVIRHEGGQPVPGFWITADKPATH